MDKQRLIINAAYAVAATGERVAKTAALRQDAANAFGVTKYNHERAEAMLADLVAQMRAYVIDPTEHRARILEDLTDEANSYVPGTPVRAVINNIETGKYTDAPCALCDSDGGGCDKCDDNTDAAGKLSDVLSHIAAASEAMDSGYDALAKKILRDILTDYDWAAETDEPATVTAKEVGL